MVSAAALSFLIAQAALVGTAPAALQVLDRCRSAITVIQQPCTLPSRFSARAVTTLLGARESAWWIVGDRLSFIARRSGAEPARLCCAIQTDMEPIAGTGFSGTTVRVPRTREAIIDVMNSGAAKLVDAEIVRGPEALPAPPKATPLAGTLTLFKYESAALGETRGGMIYVPAGVADGARLPVIYLADGATTQFAPILEAAVRDGRAAPAMIVGIHSADGYVAGCGKRNCDRRNLDYIANQTLGETEPDAQFLRHLRFVADELVPWVEARYPASPRHQDRIVAGYSSGAAWAFATAALRPAMFGNVLGMSSGSAATIHLAGALKTTRIYTGAGIFEPSFLKATRERARLARAAGADVLLREMIAGHSMSM